jgi:signal transduction histidine kinase
MAHRLEQLFYAQKRLLRDISHELRSPLARMRVACALIQPSNSSTRENVDHLELEMERLDSLIGQIIVLSQPDNVGLDARNDWIDLTSLIEAIVADARYEITQMDCKVILDLGDAVIIKSEGMQLRPALENIIRNALHHTAASSSVHISTSIVGQESMITVSDEGEGVPDDQLEHIFEPFYRVDTSRNREHEGLGLAIASQVVQQHNGSIKADNGLEGGLIVTIRLPIAKDSHKLVESSDGSLG